MIKKKKFYEKRALILFILPAGLVIIFSQAYPLIYSFFMSFLQWELAESLEPKGFIGFQNYLRAFKDSVFLNAFKISIIFCIIATSFEIVLGFIIAYFTLGENLFLRLARTILILPMVIAPVANGTIWRMMLNSQSGLINQLLGFVDIQGPNWLGIPGLALFSVIIIDIWQWTPFAIIVFSAGLSMIPKELSEAAEVDGAGRVKILRYIIIPYIFPIAFIVLLFRLVDTLLVIDAVYTTTFGGPGFSTNVITLFIYWQALRYFNISYASATSWLLSILTLTMAFSIIKWQNRVQKRLWGV
jgi:ABC-type sugar transport system permease subunit